MASQSPQDKAFALRLAAGARHSRRAHAFPVVNDTEATALLLWSTLLQRFATACNDLTTSASTQGPASGDAALGRSEMRMEQKLHG